MITNEIKKNNVKQLEYAGDNMKALASRMKTLNTANPDHADALGSSIVEASFFVNSFAMAGQAFRTMVTDLNENGGARGDVLFYLFEEANKFKAEREAKKEKEA